MQQACLCACKVYLRLKAKRGWPDILISVSEQTAGGECSLKKIFERKPLTFIDDVSFAKQTRKSETPWDEM